MTAQLKPRGIGDLTGWHRITCKQAEAVMATHIGLSTFVAAAESSNEESDLFFCEWWFRGLPLMRDYSDPEGCRHYGAADETAAAKL